MVGNWKFWSRGLRGKLPEYALLLIGTGLTVGISAVGLRAIFAEQTARELRPKAGDAVQEGASTQRVGVSSEIVVPGGNFAGTYVDEGDRVNKPTQVIGELRMPALQLTAPIISGITTSDLLRGVGHIPGSGNAGGLGNMAVAGHRDTYFRPLRRVAPGMLIMVSSPTGTYRYKVDKTEIVSPEQLGILDIGDRPQLTLITCYPFDYIGAAPKRFIVFAHLLSVEPDV